MRNKTKRWLTLREAASYASIGEARLVKMARNGEIKGFQDRALKTKPWIFDLNSLDSYREAQCAQPTYQDKALAILKGISI
jgi:hypothetical protein